MNEKRLIGDRAEQAVADALSIRGFTVIARNFSVHNVGEIDIAMIKGNTVYVIEVKSRLDGNHYQSAQEAVSAGKIRRIKNTTRYLISRFGLEDKDVIFLAGCVTHNAAGVVQKIEIIPFE